VVCVAGISFSWTAKVVVMMVSSFFYASAVPSPAGSGMARPGS
jgi:hypothetical protein